MKRHVSIFMFLLGAFVATGPFATQAEDSIRVSTFGVFYPESDVLDGTDVARESFFDPNYNLALFLKSLGSFTVSLKTISPGWNVDCWLEQDSNCLRPSDYKGEPIAGTGGMSSYTYTTDHIDKGGVSVLAVKFGYMPLTVSFHPNGGSGSMASISGKNIDSEFALPTCQFIRVGYEMTGWTNSVGTAFSNGQPNVKGADFWNPVTTNFSSVLYANWTANVYTVTFNGNGGGTPSPASKTVTFDSTYGDLATCERNGWQFNGWWTESDTGLKIEPTTKVSIISNQTLYAHWTQQFTVTFREDEKFKDTTPGKDGVLKVESVVKGESVTPPADPVHSGYRFTGWSGTYTGVTKNENVYATYQGNSYSIILHAHDGSERVSEDPRVYGEAARELLPMSRTGYTLRGWAESADSTEVKYQPRELVANLATEGYVHLYALWTPISYSVAFDKNGGSGSMDPLTPKYGESFTVPACEFEKKGCVFGYWSAVINNVTTNFEVGATVSNLTSEAGATVTFKAEWTGYYTVAFDANGGEGTMTNLTFEQDVEYALPSNAFTKTGYGFYGWATNLNDAVTLKKPICTNEEAVVNLAAAGETCMLYAEWQTNRYTVVFDPNGAKSGSMDPQEFLYDEEQKLAKCMFDRGDSALWSFAGWAVSPGGDPLYGDEESVKNLTAEEDDTITLHAVWKSELSPFALALGCDNLNWTNAVGKSAVWNVGTVDFRGKEISCVYASGNAEAILRSSNLATNGVLHFWWKADGPRENLIFDSDVQDLKTWRLDGGEDPDYADWHETNVVVNCMSENEIFYFSHLRRGSDPVGDFTCWIAKLTWTPEGGSEHPVPTDADKVTISSAAVSDGKFVLSFKSDEKFDYNLLTNANLLINSWGILDVFAGDGSVHTFKPEIRDDQPQLFYKVDTIQRK